MVTRKGITMTITNYELEAHKGNCFLDIMDEEYGCKYGPNDECPINKG